MSNEQAANFHSHSILTMLAFSDQTRTVLVWHTSLWHTSLRAPITTCGHYFSSFSSPIYFCKWNNWRHISYYSTTYYRYDNMNIVTGALVTKRKKEKERNLEEEQSRRRRRIKLGMTTASSSSKKGQNQNERARTDKALQEAKCKKNYQTSASCTSQLHLTICFTFRLFFLFTHSHNVGRKQKKYLSTLEPTLRKAQWRNCFQD